MPKRLVKIEDVAPPRDAATARGRLSRLVFWTKTKRLTQSLVVAVIGGEGSGEKGDGEGRRAYVRIQSAGLARVPDAHPRIAAVMAYMLDRNFAMTGAQFARDASDGEVVMRADVPCASGLADDDFLQALESVLGAADEESPRLAALIGEEPATE